MSLNNTQVSLLLPWLFDGKLHANIEFLVMQVDSRSFTQEGVWTAQDFPTEVDEQYPITQVQYQALKLHWIGTPVISRDPRVTDQLLKSWGVRSWKEYVLRKMS
jgi:hypothetical protein